MTSCSVAIIIQIITQKKINIIQPIDIINYQLVIYNNLKTGC